MTAQMTAAQYLETMTETEMEQTVRKLVNLRGGRLFHVRRSDAAPELTDLLDWLIIDPMSKRVFLVEVKSQKRAVTTGQAVLAEMLSQCHIFESGIVRPTPRPGETSFADFFAVLAGNRGQEFGP